MHLRNRAIEVLLCAALATTAGCGKKEAPASTGSAPVTPTPGNAAQPAGGTGDKPTPKPMPPFETLAFTKTDDKVDSGWPKFDAVNLGDKPVVFAAIYGFAYDKDGKLLKRLSTPLSWNSETAPGEKSMFPVSVGTWEKEKVSADAVTFELCYDTIKFKGEDKSVDDNTLCTDKRPKGGIKSKVGAAAAAPAGAAAAGAKKPAVVIPAKKK